MNRARRAYLVRRALKECLAEIRRDLSPFVISLAILILGIVYVWTQLPPLPLYLLFLVSTAAAFFILVITYFLYREISEAS
jgi:hypothetical protein